MFKEKDKKKNIQRPIFCIFKAPLLLRLFWKWLLQIIFRERYASNAGKKR